jgi:hypothetical protein
MLRFLEYMVLSNNLRPNRDQETEEWITYIMMNFMICNPHQKYWGNQIKKDVVSESCDRSGGKEK